MIIFNDKIELDNETAHWYIDQAEEQKINVFDLFKIVLTEKYINQNMEE